MQVVSNKSNIPLAAAVWAVVDNYDHVDAPNYISVTSLMKPVREIVLSKRLEAEDRMPIDVLDLIPSALGSTVHAALEHAWTHRYADALLRLGYDAETIKSVLINPNPEDITPTSIPVYVEQRQLKPFNGFVIGGKFDLVIEGRLHDLKTTSAYSWVYKSKIDDYRIQGSIYRWLNQDKITSDTISIVLLFTDWSASSARTNPKYPSKRVEILEVKLLSIEETEAYLQKKTQAILDNINKEQSAIPYCSRDELWMKDPIYKYYADPEKTEGRSTKNFDSLLEAQDYLKSKRGKGVILTTDPLPNRCGYCSAAGICTQRMEYFSQLEWQD